MARNLFTPRKADPSKYPTTLHAAHNMDELLRKAQMQQEMRELYGKVKLSGALEEADLRDPALAQALLYLVARHVCLEMGNHKKVKKLVNRLEKFV